jgi:hypothetical protein
MYLLDALALNLPEGNPVASALTAEWECDGSNE